MMSPLPRSPRSLVPIILAFVMLFATAGAALWLSAQSQTAAGWVRHTLEVKERIGRVQGLLADLETGQRGFLLTGRDSYLTPYQTARQNLPAEIDALVQQTADNPRQVNQVALLRQQINAKLAVLEETLSLYKEGRTTDAVTLLNTDSGNRIMDHIRDVFRAMREEEDLLLQQRTSDAEWINRFVQIALLIGACLVIATAFLAVSESRRRMIELQRANTQLAGEIAERAAAESQVRQLQKMEAVGQLTGGIAHDFNNMLAIVIGSLDMARRRLTGDEDERVKTYLQNAMEGAERAATLTKRLLAFSRQQPLEPKPVDANKLVGGMSELLRRTIGEPIQIETVLSGGLWRTFADPVQLENALINLAVNARDAMPEGGKLTIETGNADLDDRYARSHAEVTAGQYMMISVTDTGIGMPQKVIERAFEPFFTTKEVGKGTGLGLAQVFGFVKQSGGHLKIYSELDHGTTVKIYLPRHTGTDAVFAGTMIPGVTLPKGSPDKVVLVVEDETQVRLVSVEALRELGYSVIHASSPSEALHQIDTQQGISLLFTDIVMPEMNGRQLAEKALEKLPGLKVLYTTGYTRNAVVHNGVLDPGTAFLAKPFTINQLAMKVREVLG